MFKSKIIMTSLILSGCGELKTDMTGQVIDNRPTIVESISRHLDHMEIPKEIKHHVAEFLFACDSSEKSVVCRHNSRYLDKIQFVDKMNGATIGTCWKCSDGSRKINIKSGVADNNSMFMKSLIYHELGHCLLDLEHKSGPVIMSPFVVDPESSGLRWHNMIKDLFDQMPGQKYILPEEEVKSDLFMTDPDSNDPC